MTTPTVSVVMSVFNGERFLPEAIESILDQSFKDFEFIIIDDGSTDRSASILDSYKNSDSRVRVFHEQHAGLVNSLNRGCALAQGKYLGRMDADDVASIDRLALQVDFLELHKEIGVLGGTVEWIDADGKSLGIYPYPFEDAEIKTELLRRCAMWHPTILLRREVLAWAGGYRHIAGAEDYDLWLRVARQFQLANLETVILKYRIHPQQVSMQLKMKQVLGTIAVQVAAQKRAEGLSDPLDNVNEITPETLVAWGIPLSEQRNEFVSECRRWNRLMCMAGEYATALKAAQEVLKGCVEGVDRWQIADLQLTVAQLLWREGRVLSSATSLGRALLTRPLLIGHLLKRSFKGTLHNSQA
jgi:hypothetical protein